MRGQAGALPHQTNKHSGMHQHRLLTGVVLRAPISNLKTTPAPNKNGSYAIKVRRGGDSYLSGTESAILNRESGDSESCDSNRAIPRSLEAFVGRDSDGDSESIFRDSTLLRGEENLTNDTPP